MELRKSIGRNLQPMKPITKLVVVGGTGGKWAILLIC